jgi:PBSX family phage terminase large subunit
LQLENGSYIELKGADNEDSLVGVGLDGIVIDEYGIVKPHVWEQILQPTLADTLGWGIFIGTPRGYNHFYSLYESAKTNADWSAFHFTTYDNPHIQRTEIERNKTQMAEDYFAQEYLADFRKFTGLVYKDFDLKVHVVDQSQIPTGYPRWRTIDAGFTNPFVCLFIAQAEDGTYIIYDEYYNQGETTKYNAEMINSQSFGQYFKTTYIDPSARQVAQDMAQFGIYAIGADNTVNQTQGYIAGIPKVAELLKINPRTNKPGLLVSRHCKNTIKEFQNYRWAEKKNKTSGNQREMPHKEHDHSMDALKYWVNSVLVLKEKPIIIKEAKPYVPNNYRTGY